MKFLTSFYLVKMKKENATGLQFAVQTVILNLVLQAILSPA